MRKRLHWKMYLLGSPFLDLLLLKKYDVQYPVARRLAMDYKSMKSENIYHDTIDLSIRNLLGESIMLPRLNNES